MVKQPDKSVRDSMNYQNYCRNILDLIMGLSYKAVNLDILIISLVCIWSVFQNRVTIMLITVNVDVIIYIAMYIYNITSSGMDYIPLPLEQDEETLILAAAVLLTEGQEIPYIVSISAWQPIYTYIQNNVIGTTIAT